MKSPVAVACLLVAASSSLHAQDVGSVSELGEVTRPRRAVPNRCSTWPARSARVEGAEIRDMRLQVAALRRPEHRARPAGPEPAEPRAGHCRSPSAASARAPPSACAALRHLRRRHPATHAGRPGPDLQHRHRLARPRRSAARALSSALYGNSSGGVIQVLHRRPAKRPPTLGFSHGRRQLRHDAHRHARSAASSGAVDYLLSGEPLRDRRLPRSQRGAARHRQRQAGRSTWRTAAGSRLIAQQRAR